MFLELLDMKRIVKTHEYSFALLLHATQLWRWLPNWPCWTWRLFQGKDDVEHLCTTDISKNQAIIHDNCNIMQQKINILTCCFLFMTLNTRFFFFWESVSILTSPSHEFHTEFHVLYIWLWPKSKHRIKLFGWKNVIWKEVDKFYLFFKLFLSIN